MMTKAAGILIVLIIAGVAAAHSHGSGPLCPSGKTSTSGHSGR